MMLLMMMMTTIIVAITIITTILLPMSRGQFGIIRCSFQNQLVSETIVGRSKKEENFLLVGRCTLCARHFCLIMFLTNFGLFGALPQNSRVTWKLLTAKKNGWQFGVRWTRCTMYSWLSMSMMSQGQFGVIRQTFAKSPRSSETSTTWS